MKRRIISVIGILAIVALMCCSCQNVPKEETEKEQKEYKVVIIYPDPMDMWDDITTGAEKARAEILNTYPGVSLDVEVFRSEDATMRSFYEIFCREEANGTDGFCLVMPRDLTWDEEIGDSGWSYWIEMNNEIETFVGQGGHVVTLGIDQVDPSRFEVDAKLHYFAAPSRECFVGSDNTLFGRKQAEKAIEIQGSNLKLIFRCGAYDNPVNILRRSGILEVMEENKGSGAELVEGYNVSDFYGHQYPWNEHPYIGSENGTGYDPKLQPRQHGPEVDDDIQMFEDEWSYLNDRGLVNTVIGVSFDRNYICEVWKGRGWYDADTNKDHIAILAEDSPDVIEAVKERLVTCTLTEDRYQWGYQGLSLMFDIIHNGTVPESDNIYTPTYMIDLSNVYDLES